MSQIIDSKVNTKHVYNENSFGMANKKYCLNTKQFFSYYQANESESQGGVNHCNRCGEVVRV